MGTTGRFGGGHGLTGPKHIWYDTDYSELYKGLAVVVGFFLFLVLLLLIFILVSYLRKWYHLKKRPAGATGATASSNDNKLLKVTSTGRDDSHIRYSKSGSTAGGVLPNSFQMPSGMVSQHQQGLKNMALASHPGGATPVEIVDLKRGSMLVPPTSVHSHSLHQQSQPLQSQLHHHQSPLPQQRQLQHQQNYQEYPPPHYPAHGNLPSLPPQCSALLANSCNKNGRNSPATNVRSTRSSLSTIALT